MIKEALQIESKVGDLRMCHLATFSVMKAGNQVFWRLSDLMLFSRET